MAYKVIDKRNEEAPKEACRVCGSSTVHMRQYNDGLYKVSSSRDYKIGKITGRENSITRTTRMRGELWAAQMRPQ